MTRKKREIIYAFIDSQNLNLGTKNDIIRKKKKIYKGWNLDFGRFRIYLKDKYKVSKAYLFIGMKPGNEKLYTALQESGYILIFKPTLEIKKEGKAVTKGNVDAELVLHAMIQYPKYNKAVIISGDGDFYCLVEYLEENKKLGRLLIPNRMAFSSLLWKFRKYIDFISALKNKLEYQKRRGQ
ncbi:NYN domain-containing protein [Patescibacteria group bacterium]